MKVVNQHTKENRKTINILALMIEIKTLNITHIAKFERKHFYGSVVKDAIYDYYIAGIFQKVFTPKNELSLRMLLLIAEHCI